MPDRSVKVANFKETHQGGKSIVVPFPTMSRLVRCLHVLESSLSRRTSGWSAATSLSPIASHPGVAHLSEAMRSVLRELARRYVVGVISGRDVADVQRLVDIDEIFYAGNRGLQIKGIDGQVQTCEEGARFLPILQQAEQRFRTRLKGIAGVVIEHKEWSIGVHYRAVRPAEAVRVAQVVEQIAAGFPELRKQPGRKAFDFLPDVHCNKGTAVLRLLGDCLIATKVSCRCTLGTTSPMKRPLRSPRGAASELSSEMAAGPQPLNTL